MTRNGGDGDGEAPIFTERVERPTSPAVVRGFTLTIVEGTGAGTTWRSVGEKCAIGSHDLNDLVLADPTVSRFHCEIEASAKGVRIRDLGSRNGITVDGVQVVEAFLRTGSLVRLGRAAIRFDLQSDFRPLRLSESNRFGGMVGGSVAIRGTFALLERAAATDATVLLEGETGTGKGAAAESIHQASARRDRPFAVVDCGAIPGPLLESELFGHEKGAFTGADARRIGAFEDAAGGTVFLDEIGELPIDLQPKLLRVLESREVRRVGGNDVRKVDVRLVAATNRDLRAEVNAGRFRSDLYFRLAVLKVPIPSLRQRPEDIPGLAGQILDSLGASPEDRAALLAPEIVAALQHGAWPGNVRELRNYLERCLVMQSPLPVSDEAPAPKPARIDVTVPYAEARRQAIEAFERAYADELLRAHKGKVAQAARAAGIARVYLYRLARRHGITF